MSEYVETTDDNLDVELSGYEYIQITGNTLNIELQVGENTTNFFQFFWFMPKGIPKNGINKGRFKKGRKPSKQELKKKGKSLMGNIESTV